MAESREEELITPSIGSSLLELKSVSNNPVQFDKCYILGERIGDGRYSVVHRAHHVSDPREEFAVKVIRRYSKRDEEAALEEASVLRTLQNVPNVIKLVDFFCNDMGRNIHDKNRIYAVHTLVEGGDVFHRLTKRQTYAEKDTRDLAAVLLTTIQQIHNHDIVHRDLKPENLLLRDKCNDSEIVICDFGNAKKLREGNSKAKCTTFCGTPIFMAPEILEGIEYGKAVDMWSVGCILFILLSGYLPFGEDENSAYFRILTGDYDFDREEWDVVSDPAKNLISNLLKLNPNERWTAQQALTSDWFTECSTEKLENSDLGRSLIGIRQYCLCSRRFNTAFPASSCCTSLIRIPNISCVTQLLTMMSPGQMVLEGTKSGTEGDDYSSLICPPFVSII